jgi:hypothetical protein
MVSSLFPDLMIGVGLNAVMACFRACDLSLVVLILEVSGPEILVKSLSSFKFGQWNLLFQGKLFFKFNCGCGDVSGEREKCAQTDFSFPKFFSLGDHHKPNTQLGMLPLLWFCSSDCLLAFELFLFFCFSLQAIMMPNLIASMCFDDVRPNAFQLHLSRLFGIALFGMSTFILHALLHGNFKAKRDCMRFVGLVMIMIFAELINVG